MLIVAGFYKQYEPLIVAFKAGENGTALDLLHNSVFQKHLAILFGCLIGYVIGLFSVVFFTTHRYYGPLVAINRFLDQLSEGNYQARVTIRKGDELQDLVEKLNGFARFLDNKSQ